MRRIAWAGAVAVVLAAAVVAVGAVGPSDRPAEVAAAPAAPPLVYVAVGGCETFGAGSGDPLRTSYPRRVFASLPLPATFVNFSAPGALVAGVLGVVPVRSADLDPDVVTVWLGAADLVAGTPVADFERDLTDLLGRMGGPGRTVLVANLPAFDEVPLALVEGAGSGDPAACGTDRLVLPTADQAAAVARWNTAIERAAAATGAAVVDVHGLVESTRSEGGLDPLGGDGFFPSDAGHEAIAAAFADAIAGALPEGEGPGG